MRFTLAKELLFSGDIRGPFGLLHTRKELGSNSHVGLTEGPLGTTPTYKAV